MPTGCRYTWYPWMGKEGMFRMNGIPRCQGWQRAVMFRMNGIPLKGVPSVASLSFGREWMTRCDLPTECSAGFCSCKTSTTSGRYWLLPRATLVSPLTASLVVVYLVPMDGQGRYVQDACRPWRLYTLNSVRPYFCITNWLKNRSVSPLSPSSASSIALISVIAA